MLAELVVFFTTLKLLIKLAAVTDSYVPETGT